MAIATHASIWEPPALPCCIKKAVRKMDPRVFCNVKHIFKPISSGLKNSSK